MARAGSAILRQNCLRIKATCGFSVRARHPEGPPRQEKKLARQITRRYIGGATITVRWDALGSRAGGKPLTQHSR